MDRTFEQTSANLKVGVKISVKIYIDAKEREHVVDRTIESFNYKGREYKPTESYPIGMTNIDDQNYLTFMCKIGSKQVDIYCEEHFAFKEGASYYKYFLIK